MNGRPWHKQKPELFLKLKEDMAAAFPALALTETDAGVFFRGPFQIFDQGKPVDLPYTLEIELPPDYPNTLPRVRDVDGRIPRITDRHVNGDGTLCVCLPDEYLASGASTWLVDFIQGPVRSFLIGNGIVERGGEWPWGERRHGTEGLLDYYGELVGSSDAATIGRYLTLLAKPEVKGHWECPCGSGARLRQCHMPRMLALRAKLPAHVAEKALAQLTPKGAT